jgi:DNA-binding transcriptional regulator YdaS (Cro superfamily)
MNKAIRKCIEIIGTQAEVATAAQVSTALVWKWLHNKTPVTAECVIPLELATNFQVTRNELRPDLYPIE